MSRLGFALGGGLGRVRAPPRQYHSGSLVAALEAVAPTGSANEQWADPNEVLRQRTLVSGLLQRGAEVSAVARAGEFWAEAAEKDVIRNGRTRRRRLVQPGVI